MVLSLVVFLYSRSIESCLTGLLQRLNLVYECHNSSDGRLSLTQVIVLLLGLLASTYFVK